MNIYQYRVHGLDGRDVPLASYQGQVLLLVNTASACGFTPQYAGLEQLHRDFAADGLVVIGFPCNQFGQQEPGSASEIGAFCQKNYGVSFLMSDKIDVNGANADPLWQFLKHQKAGVLGSRRIKWNFTKFLVDRQGRVVARYGSLTKPAAMAEHIKALL
ncbi:glutathione peroxidase [Vogesella sp. LIG4]|uniref:glutathione peroxidase n=1 Tax=Vogesella sp. LIG4 TaxID=1192162 RepID=UPI0008201276|nr:glutathione peroxidase [Vogesella sp. LIG4]SCK20863.1 glutathione peroxidase [Vogesella sp. LIG4]